MNVGVFSNAPAYAGLSPEVMAEQMKAAGFDSVQLYLTMPDLPDHPSQLSEEACARIRNAFQSQGIKIITLGAFGNIAHPDPTRRREAIELVRHAAMWAKAIGTDMVSTMTGSYNVQDEWLDHPFNHSTEALISAISGISEANSIAADYGVKLCVEPYYLSIVDTSERMLQVLQAVGPNLGVMYDPAAMVGPDRIHNSKEALTHDFKLLFEHFYIVHVEDVYFENGEPHFVKPGLGGIDWTASYELLRTYRWNGPIVIEVHTDVEEQRQNILRGVGRVS